MPGTVLESSAGPKASENFKFSASADRDWELVVNLRDLEDAQFILTVTPDLADMNVGKEYFLKDESMAIKIPKEMLVSKCEFYWSQCYVFASIRPALNDTKKVNFTVLFREIQDLSTSPIQICEGKCISTQRLTEIFPRRCNFLPRKAHLTFPYQFNHCETKPYSS
jgi:hypothetical protein